MHMYMNNIAYMYHVYLYMYYIESYMHSTDI